MPDKVARRLRQNLTNSELRLWFALRDRRLADYKFRRQHRIGEFIADFACTKQKIIIEADGGQHSDNSADLRRTEFLQAQGWKVMRFWNDEILSNTEGVIETIVKALRAG